MTLHRLNRRSNSLVVLGLVVLPGLAIAQDEPADPLDQVGGWTVQAEPSAWYVSPAGRFRLPGATGAGFHNQILDDLGLDSPRLAPLGEVHVRADDWRFTLGGLYVSADGSRVQNGAGSAGPIAYAAGDTIGTDFQITSVELLAARQPFARFTPGRFDAGIDLMVGVRLFDLQVDMSVTPAGGSAPTTTSADGFFGVPIIGAKLNMEIADHFTVDARTTIGYLAVGDTQTTTWDIMVGGTWRPTEHFGLQIGYRHLDIDLEDGRGLGELRYDGSLAGLYVGGQIRY